MKKWIFSLLLITSIAMAGTYTRQAEDNIVDGLRIDAADINNELDAIQSAVNAIDTTNVTDGSLTTDDYAATRSAVVLDKKYGCELQRSATDSVQVLRPCELVISGSRSLLTATQTVSLATDLDTGSGAAGTYYYVYGADNSGDITFEFSTTAPQYVNSKKTGDTSKKYIGVVRTLDSSVDIMDFKQYGNKFMWELTYTEGQDALTNLQLNRNATDASSDSSFVTPLSAQAYILQYEAFVNAFPGQCSFEYTEAGNGHSNYFQAIVLATGNNGHVGYFPNPVPAADIGGFGPAINVNVNDISNCHSGRVTIRGWIDPAHFHQ